MGSLLQGPRSRKDGSYPVQCADLTVPLDYSAKKSNSTLTLELLRVPALKKPSKGSVLFNYGGPGQVGRMQLALEADQYLS